MIRDLQGSGISRVYPYNEFFISFPKKKNNSGGNAAILDYLWYCQVHFDGKQKSHLTHDDMKVNDADHTVPPSFFKKSSYTGEGLHLFQGA